MDSQQLKAAGLYPIEHNSGRPAASMPEHVQACPRHAALWVAWRDNGYDWRNPMEWGGGHIMDSRTSHEERAYQWAEKNTAQMDAIAQSCEQGRSCGAVEEEA